MKKLITRLDYCQFLLVSQINDTFHCEQFSYETINRYLRGERIISRLIWENVHGQVVDTPLGYVVFGDTVLDKQALFAIESVRRQYSGNAKAVSKGIGVVTCVYVNPERDQFWLIGSCLYNPQGDGKSKLDHVREILSNIVYKKLVYQKRLSFHAALMDAGYAAKALMLLIKLLAKIYSCPLKDNRQVDDSQGQRPYCRMDLLKWNLQEWVRGKRIKIKGFPKDKVRLFRVRVSAHRADWVVTNDSTQNSTQATQQVCGFRWKIEQLHREGKQLTGLERCQCRKAHIQRNHIGCAFLAWVSGSQNWLRKLGRPSTSLSTVY